MREIKFRVWLWNEKEMSEVLVLDNQEEKVFVVRKDGAAGWRMFAEVELMQYTGLKDKNGVEIYEGDVVEADIAGIFSCEVVFRNGRFTMRSIEDGDREYLWILNEKCKVIGNRFENPELIGKNRIGGQRK